MAMLDGQGIQDVEITAVLTDPGLGLAAIPA